MRVSCEERYETITTHQEAEFGDMQEANHQNSTGRIRLQIEAVCIFKSTLVSFIQLWKKPNLFTCGGTNVVKY